MATQPIANAVASGGAATMTTPFIIDRGQLVELLAMAIYAREAMNCKSLEEAVFHRTNWRRAIPEATAMIEFVEARRS